VSDHSTDRRCVAGAALAGPCHFSLQLDREKQAEAVLQELASIIARYRGPLLESSVDLEQRLWHLATMTGEVRCASSSSSSNACWVRVRKSMLDEAAAAAPLAPGHQDRRGDEQQ
jgi:hypothetical protein